DSGSILQSAVDVQITCNTDSDKIIGFYVGPQLETVLNDACAAMMLPCAYQNHLPNDTFCRLGCTIQVSSFLLRSCTRIDRLSQFSSFERSKMQMSALMACSGQSKTDGYFACLLEIWAPEKCHCEEGFGVVNFSVGGETSLNGTVFDVSIVAEQGLKF
ncbi:hypothetical protein P153DRAFT_280995, partial [Dothidotthia symphoricarpi CBS 119687]